MRALAIREGLNLKRCTAYSDSYNDVPMLSLVGTAVAINPDADCGVSPGPRAGLGDPRLPHRPQGRPHRVPSALAPRPVGGSARRGGTRRH